MGGATIRLFKEIDWSNAMRYLLTADEITAQEALKDSLSIISISVSEILTGMTTPKGRSKDSPVYYTQNQLRLNFLGGGDPSIASP